MAEPKEYVQPHWKQVETAGARRAAAEERAAERLTMEQILARNRAEIDARIAREDHAIRNARFCAGHDWEREYQERTGERKRSR